MATEKNRRASKGDWNEEGCEMRPRWQGRVGEREGGERERGQGRGELGK